MGKLCLFGSSLLNEECKRDHINTLGRNYSNINLEMYKQLITENKSHFRATMFEGKAF